MLSLPAFEKRGSLGQEERGWVAHCRNVMQTVCRRWVPPCPCFLLFGAESLLKGVANSDSYLPRWEVSVQCPVTHRVWVGIPQTPANETKELTCQCPVNNLSACTTQVRERKVRDKENANWNPALCRLVLGKDLHSGNDELVNHRACGTVSISQVFSLTSRNLKK